MATYYFDADLGSNTTGDGSIGNPWQYYDGKYSSTAAGDRLLFKRHLQLEHLNMFVQGALDHNERNA